MRSALVAAVALGTVLVAGSGSAAPVPPPVVPDEAVRAVKGAAPKGWSVSLKGDTLTVRRDKPVRVYNPIGAPPGLTPEQMSFDWVYEVALTFRPKVGPREFDALAKENEQRGRKLDEMREGLRAAGIRHKFDDWLPNSDLQERMVAEYRAEQKKLHRLPDLYSDTHSIELTDSRGHSLFFTDPAQREECEGAKQALRKLFKAYRAETP